MKFEQLARLRYSVRKFDKRHVESEKIEKILHAAQLAPTAKNKQSWRVLVINEHLELEKLKSCTPCHYDAPLAFLVCCDHNDDYIRGNDGMHSGVIDASIAATHMTLAACDNGVGSTWVMNFEPDKMRATFHVPLEYEIVALLVCGYPSEDSTINKRHGETKSLDELCYYNSFQKNAQSKSCGDKESMS